MIMITNYGFVFPEKKTSDENIRKDVYLYVKTRWRGKWLLDMVKFAPIILEVEKYNFINMMSKDHYNYIRIQAIYDWNPKNDNIQILKLNPI